MAPVWDRRTASRRLALPAIGAAGKIRLAVEAAREMLNNMKYIIAIVLIAVGAGLIYHGHRRADSIVGLAEKTGKDIANAFDGRTRKPNYISYYIGGGALIAAGAWIALRKPAAGG